MAKRVLVQIICDKCASVSDAADQDVMYRYQIAYGLWDYPLDLCATCAEELDEWTSLSKEATKRVKKRKVAAVPTASMNCPKCAFVGKNSHSLNMHLSRAGHR